MSLFSELKRRNVLRVGAAYIIFAWIVIQVVETILPSFGYGDGAIRTVTLVFAAGFIPALVLSWVFELTAEGLKKDKDIDPSRPVAAQSGKKLDRIIMLALALALGYFAIDKFVLDPARDETKVEIARQEGREDALVNASGDNSVAVLPFVNMSSDPEQEYFADGMTEEILNILARVPALRVTARTSSFFFKGQDLPISSIAEALNVRYILEGSVRKSGNRVRITAQLIEAGSDRHLWSETFDRDLEDVFDIQDEVAEAIAGALVESFDGLNQSPVSRSASLAAFEAFRTGRLRWWRRSPGELHQAIELFEKSISHDPGFAPAYAAIADSWLLLILYGGEQILEGIDKARPMIDKALEINPDSAEAFAARGLSHMIIGEKDEAEAAYGRAISLDEEYIPAYVWMSVLLADLGRVPEQGAILQQAMAKDPLNELLASNYASNLQLRGDYRGAVEQMEGLLRLQPDNAVLLITVSNLALDSGDLVEAWKHAKAAHDLVPDSTSVITTLARVWVKLNRFDEADRLMVASIENARRNVDLKLQYLTQLTIQGRAEDAAAMIPRIFGEDVSSLPAAVQRTFHYHMGLIELVNENYLAARDHLEQSINPDQTKLFEGNHILVLTLTSMLNRGIGDEERAEQQLQMAERVVGHARVNGIDTADLYYAMACLFALRGENQRALATLRKAYDKGFRRLWALDQDGRIALIRDEPAFQEIRQQVSAEIEQAAQAIESLR